jgi:RHS repeat-associated protein
MAGNLNGYSLTYDGAYRTVGVTDGNSHTTSYQYSTAGYLSKVTYPTTETLQALTWDNDGKVLTAKNGRGQALTLTYADNESRLTQVASPNVNNSYTYDSYGRLQSLSDVTGSQNFTYDDDDLSTAKVVTYSGLPHTASSFDFSYGYNNDGSRGSLGVSNSGTGLNIGYSYTYNGRGELTALVNPYSETFSWTYLDNGWLWTQRQSNSATTAFTYNALGQLLDLSNKTIGGTTLSDFNTSGAGHYDGAGNLLGISSSLPAAPASYSGTSTYAYDSHDQLNTEQVARFGGYTNSFAFDGAGNPTTFKGATQTFNSSNQNNAISYDTDGNPTTWNGNALTFDAANHLTAIGTLLTAGYNAEGLRGWKQSSSGMTYFLYDGLTPIAETDGNGNVTAVNTWGVNGLASRRNVSTNASTFYSFDVQGSTVQRLDSSGNVLGSYGYDAFGVRVGTDSSTDPYCGYGAQAGYYRDCETGLSLLGHRYYNPSQGRFLNRDPIEQRRQAELACRSTHRLRSMYA